MAASAGECYCGTSKGSYAVDVGVHIGFHTLLLSKLVGHQGHVPAFEPSPWNFSVLAENVKINDCNR